MKVSSQEELDTALKNGDAEIELVGDNVYFVKGKAIVTSRGESVVHSHDESVVHSYDESVVYSYGKSVVDSHDGSVVHSYDESVVYSYGKSVVDSHDGSVVYSYGKSVVYSYDGSVVYSHNESIVHSYDESIVHSYDESIVFAHQHSVIYKLSVQSVITGGIQIIPSKPTTTAEWLEHYELIPTDGVVILYKATYAQYISSHNVSYMPGSVPQAPDWDGGKIECGGGLHFCPTPGHALGFKGGATHLVACPVRVSDIVVTPNAAYPTKIKARGCCAPVWECDIHGNAIATKGQAE